MNEMLDSLFTFGVVVCFIFLAAGAVSLAIFGEDEKLPEHVPQWEVIPAHEAIGELVGYQVRWSIPDDAGRFLWVGHYFAGPDTSLQWCEHAAKSHCRRLNEQKKMPCEFGTFHFSAPI